MNIMDFVNSLKLQLNDLENVGKIGFDLFTASGVHGFSEE
jgi:hypothetical protein